MNRYIFTTTLPGSGDSGVILTFMKSMPNAKKFAIVKHPDEWAEAKASEIVKNYKAAGLELVTTVELERKASDATAQVLRLQSSGADVVVTLLYPPEAAIFLRDALKYGLKGPFLGTVGTQDLKDLADRAGGPAALANFYTASFLRQGPDHPDMKEYADLMKKYFPNDRVTALNFYGMSGAYTLVDAMKRVGKDLTREKLIATLEQTKDGFAGPGACKVNITPQSHVGCREGTMWKLVNGQIVNVGSTWREVAN
jgi:branched-chain amino acid transport system substrate-binding protein